MSGALLGALGHLLGASWASLGRSWASLGRLWGLLGASWAPLGRILGVWGSILDGFRGGLEEVWGVQYLKIIVFYYLKQIGISTIMKSRMGGLACSPDNGLDRIVDSGTPRSLQDKIWIARDSYRADQNVGGFTDHQVSWSPASE